MVIRLFLIMQAVRAQYLASRMMGLLLLGSLRTRHSNRLTLRFFARKI